MPARKPFVERVYDAVRAIPPGRVATYGDVAAAAGRPGAARAVGTLMANLQERAGASGGRPYNGGGRAVPAHRVVGAGGALGGYGGHESLKAALLRGEGLTVIGTRIRDFAAARWTTRSRRPRSVDPARRGRSAGPRATGR